MLLLLLLLLYTDSYKLVPISGISIKRILHRDWFSTRILSRHRRVFTWGSNYRDPTFRNLISVIGHQRHLHVNYPRFNGFLFNAHKKKLKENKWADLFKIVLFYLTIRLWLWISRWSAIDQVRSCWQVGFS